MQTKRALQKQAKKLLQLSLNEAGAIEKKRVDQVLAYIANQPSTEQLPLLRAYKRLLERYQQAHTATIATSSSASKELITTLSNEIIKQYGKDMTIITTEDSSIIAGVKVTVSDVIYDNTVASKFAAIKESIT